MLHLTVLNLSNNKLTIVHGVHHLKSLMELVLDSNLIEEFQPEIASLPKLRRLSAKNNRILKHPCIVYSFALGKFDGKKISKFTLFEHLVKRVWKRIDQPKGF